MENWPWWKSISFGIAGILGLVGIVVFSKLASPQIVSGGICVTWIVLYFLREKKNPLALEKENLVTWIFFILAFFALIYHDIPMFRFSSAFLIIFLLFTYKMP